MVRPVMHRVRQLFDATHIEDVPAAVRREIGSRNLSGRCRPGQSACVAVGSRGIRHLPEIVAEVVAALKELGLSPFIMPAMGSHGGATAEGQVSILTDLGVTEAAVGAPVRSSMAVTCLDSLSSGAEVFLADDALAADHLVVINRVKPHTAFRSEVESGLCKMLTVGCGKHRGALTMHRFGLGDTIVPAAEVILNRCSVLFGLAILENSMEETCGVHVALSEEIVEQDARLLKTAWDLLPRVPVDDLDVLVIDEMGKNISGAGIDPNVVGLWRRNGGPRAPDYRTIIVLDLTPESHGNATGIGIADLTTQRVWDLIDRDATYTNTVTSGIWPSARFPMALADDRAAVDAAFSRLPDAGKSRLIRITSTLFLENVWASEALLPELSANPRVEVDPEPLSWKFDESGRLLPFSRV